MRSRSLMRRSVQLNPDRRKGRTGGSRSVNHRQGLLRPCRDLGDDPLCDGAKRLTLPMLRVGGHNGLARVSGLADLARQRKFSQEGHAELPGHLLASAMAEQLGAIAAT